VSGGLWSPRLSVPGDVGADGTLTDLPQGMAHSLGCKLLKGFKLEEITGLNAADYVAGIGGIFE